MMTEMEILANLLLFLVPFERIPSVEVIGITVRLSFLVIFAFLIYYGYLLVKRKEQFLPLSKIDWSIIGFVGVIILSNLVATSRHRSLTVTAFILFVVAGYLLISRAYRKNFSYQKISRVILLSAGVATVFGFYQFFGDAFGLSHIWTGIDPAYSKAVFGFPRFQSVGIEPLYFANYLLLPIFITVGAVLTGTPFRRRSALLLTVFLLALFLTLSRGGYLGFAFGLLFISVVLALKKRLIFQRLGLTIAVTVLAFALSSVVISVVTSVGHHTNGTGGRQSVAKFVSQATVSDFGNSDSTAGRIDHFKEAYRLFKTKPILGIGVGNYGVVNRLQPYSKKYGYKIVNNFYLETLAELGILGFGAFLVLIYFLGSKCWTSMHNLSHDAQIGALVLLTVLLAVGVQANFFSTIYIIFLWVLIGLIDALPQRAA